MFKKTKDCQLGLFSSPSSLLSGKSKGIYENSEGWHNLFRKHVTNQIDEICFKPLYCSNNGTPNAPIRVLVAMMILKEAEGLSDQKLFENCRFNMLTRSALGLLNTDDPVPTDSTYYLFRKRISDYQKAGNENLLDVVFAQVTKNQCIDFEVSGKYVRMDSKLLGSNIAWLSRYELIHETLRLFYNEVKALGKIDQKTQQTLNNLLKLEGNKVVYISTTDEVKIKLQQLGSLIYSILPLFSALDSSHYPTLRRVFQEQFKLNEEKVVVSRDKEEISAQSVQSPHDLDCTYRNKDGNKVKGYSINVTESCDDGEVLNLIGQVDVSNASTPDLDFFQDAITGVEEVFTSKTEAVHADGAYHSVSNQEFCKNRDNPIELYLHAIQGAQGRFKLEFVDDKLWVWDTLTNEFIQSKKLINKEGDIKWSIKVGNNYRYFNHKDIDTYLIRKKITETPIQTLQKRNNVEATIFQLAYHYSNAKSRYRGLIKHQMWANMRCLWINFVRIVKYLEKLWLKGVAFANNVFLNPILGCLYAFYSFVRESYNNKYSKNRFWTVFQS